MTLNINTQVTNLSIPEENEITLEIHPSSEPEIISLDSLVSTEPEVPEVETKPELQDVLSAGMGSSVGNLGPVIPNLSNQISKQFIPSQCINSLSKAKLPRILSSEDYLHSLLTISHQEIETLPDLVPPDIQLVITSSAQNSKVSSKSLSSASISSEKVGIDIKSINESESMVNSTFLNAGDSETILLKDCDYDSSDKLSQIKIVSDTDSTCDPEVLGIKKSSQDDNFATPPEPEPTLNHSPSRTHDISAFLLAKQRLLIGLYGVVLGVVLTLVFVWPLAAWQRSSMQNFLDNASPQDKETVQITFHDHTCISPRLIDEKIRGYGIHLFYSIFIFVAQILFKISDITNMGFILNDVESTWRKCINPFLVVSFATLLLEVCFYLYALQLNPNMILIIRAIVFFFWSFWFSKNIQYGSLIPKSFTKLYLGYLFLYGNVLLTYLFLVFPSFLNPDSSLLFKFFIRVVAHPILTEFATLFGRLFSSWLLQYLGIESHPEYFNMGPVMIMALYGRFLIASVQDPWFQYLIIFFISIQELTFRATTWFRDNFYYWNRKSKTLFVDTSVIHYHFYFFDEIAESAAIVVSAGIFLIFQVHAPDSNQTYQTWNLLTTVIVSLLLDSGLDAIKSYYYFERYAEKYRVLFNLSTANMSSTLGEWKTQKMSTISILYWLHLDFWVDYFWRNRNSLFLIIAFVSYIHNFLWFWDSFIMKQICYMRNEGNLEAMIVSFN